MPKILYSAVLRSRQQPSLLPMSSLSSRPPPSSSSFISSKAGVVVSDQQGRGGFHPLGRELGSRHPRGGPTRDFVPSLRLARIFQICEFARNCAFAHLRIVGAKRIKIANLKMHNSQLWKSGTPYCTQGGGMPQKEHIMSRVSFIFCKDSIARTSAHKYTYVTLLSNSKFKLLNKRHKDE
jgi:hypothetical protein